MLTECFKSENQTASDIKASNMNNIMLSLLLGGTLTKTELMQLTGLSASTVSDCTNRLLKTGLVQGCGSNRSTGGRKPTLFTIARGFAATIGIVLNGSGFEVCASDLDGTKLFDEEVSADGTPAITNLYSVVENALDRLSNTQIVSIGFGVDGELSVSSGIVFKLDRFGWNNVPLKELMERRYGIFTCIDHPVNAAALYQRLFGLGRELAHFICAFEHYPDKVGVILDDRILHGEQNLCGSVTTRSDVRALMDMLKIPTLIADGDWDVSGEIKVLSEPFCDFAYATALMAETHWFRTIYDVFKEEVL